MLLADRAAPQYGARFAGDHRAFDLDAGFWKQIEQLLGHLPGGIGGVTVSSGAVPFKANGRGHGPSLDREVNRDLG